MTTFLVDVQYRYYGYKTERFTLTASDRREAEREIPKILGDMWQKRYPTSNLMGFKHAASIHAWANGGFEVSIRLTDLSAVPAFKVEKATVKKVIEVEETVVASVPTELAVFAHN